MLGFDLDYARVRAHFGTELVRAYYYTAVKPRTTEPDPLVPLLDWLVYNGYKLVRKETKTYIDPEGRTKLKGNMDMEIAVDALDMSPHVTDIWLFSGDADFRYLVEALQRRGVRVTIVSSIRTLDRFNNPNPVCSDELRRCADVFVDLDEPGWRKAFAQVKEGMKSRHV